VLSALRSSYARASPDAPALAIHTDGFTLSASAYDALEAAARAVTNAGSSGSSSSFRGSLPLPGPLPPRELVCRQPNAEWRVWPSHPPGVRIVKANTSSKRRRPPPDAAASEPTIEAPNSSNRNTDTDTDAADVWVSVYLMQMLLATELQAQGLDWLLRITASNLVTLVQVRSSVQTCFLVEATDVNTFLCRRHCPWLLEPGSVGL
jgi:hypothetical protein